MTRWTYHILCCWTHSGRLWRSTASCRDQSRNACASTAQNLNQAYSEYKHVLDDISRSPLYCHVHWLPIRTALCCHSNEPIANPPNSAQLGGNPYRSSSYIRVHAVVWACGRGQTDTQTHRQTDRHTHRRAWPQYILRRLRLTQNVTTSSMLNQDIDKSLQEVSKRQARSV